MNCRQAKELIPAYELGALEEKERAQVEAHLRTCSSCLALFHDYGQVTTALARVGDAIQPPPGLRQRLLERLGPQPSPLTAPHPSEGLWDSLGRALRRRLAAGAMAVMAVSLLGLIVGTVLLWSEVREMRREESQLSATLQAQLSNLAIENQQTSETLLEQRDLVYMAAIPGTSTVLLEGTEDAPQSRGMFMVTPKGTWAILVALQLQPLPQDKAYQLWLLTNGTRTSGGLFTVDETGYGQLGIRSGEPVTNYQSLGVTIEPAGGSPAPTGDKVLGGNIPPLNSR